MIGDRYILEREVGRGGMGAVWLARDRVLGRHVAIKRVGEPSGGGADEIARVEREARLAARLNHPNVVAVFDLIEHDDQHWLVMEYVAGTTLAAMIRAEGPLDSDRAAPILAEAASALAAAHAAGVVHRDVKPSNILIGRDGHVRLSDFGIARAETDAALTATGLITGSPGYIAPEVAQGRPATGASDVWSLGATAYHALTGHPAYAVNGDVIGTLHTIVHEQPPRVGTELWLEPFVTAAMSHDERQRWSMDEVATFLRSRGQHLPVPIVATETTVVDREPTTRLAQGALGHEPEQPRHAAEQPTRGSWWSVAALVALLVVILAGGWALVTRGGDDGPPAADSTGPTASPGEQETTGDSGPTERQQMRRFVRRYLLLADSSPEDAWARLTPGYQHESGGLEGYLSFWGRVSNVRDIQVEDVDPEALTVTYSYTYDLAGEGRQDDRVRLRLDQPSEGSGYLIAAGETLG